MPPRKQTPALPLFVGLDEGNALPPMYATRTRRSRRRRPFRGPHQPRPYDRFLSARLPNPFCCVLSVTRHRRHDPGIVSGKSSMSAGRLAAKYIYGDPQQ